MYTHWDVISKSWLWEDDAALDKPLAESDWTWEEYRALENALFGVHPDDVKRWERIALAVPGKTIEELKLQYVTLGGDAAEIEFGVRSSSIRSPGTSMPRGVTCTEEEHREFLRGLEVFDKGDWNSISRFSVPSKSSTQVASHAQKYHKRSTTKVEKRSSIHDIKTSQTERRLALDKATTSRLPRHPEKGPTNDGKKYRMRVHTCTSSAVAPTCSMLTAPFIRQPPQKPDSSVGMPPPFLSEQDCGVPPAGSCGVSSTSYPDYIDPDEFKNFPHFLD